MQTDLPVVELAKMTKHQKLAALLIILGPDSAAQILKNLDEHEIEAALAKGPRRGPKPAEEAVAEEVVEDEAA